MTNFTPRKVGYFFPELKITTFDIHPVHPLLILSTPTNEIILSDYESGIILLKTNLQTMYKEKREEVEIVKQLEVQYGNIHLPVWYTSYKSDFDRLVTDRKFSKIISVKFFDENVCFWKLRFFHSPNTEKIFLLKKINEDNELRKNVKKFIAIQTDHRILLFFYCNASNNGSKMFVECKSSVLLENKSISCFEFLCKKNSIAIGCSDGYVRIWDYEKREILPDSKLKVHSKQIVKMIVVNTSDVTEHNYPYLLTCSMDGSLCLWNLDGKSNVLLKNKLHGNNPIVDMFHVQTNNTCITIGNDKSIAITNLLNGDVQKINFSKELSIKQPMKYITLLNTGNESDDIIFSNELLSIHKVSNNLKKESYNSFQIFSGTKKKKSITNIMSHPLLNNTLFVSTVEGLLMYEIDSFESRVVECIQKRFISSTNEMYYERSVFNSSNFCVFQREVLDNNTLGLPKKRISDLFGKVNLECSPSGKFLCVHFFESFLLKVYNTKNWKIVLEKNGVNTIGWNLNQDNEYFAYLENGKSVSDTKTLFIYKDFQVVRQIDKLTTNKMHGGLYYGLTKGPELIFYDWETSNEISPASGLPIPVSIQWDKTSFNFLAIYENSFAIFKKKDNEIKLLSYCKEIITDCYWFNSSLFIITKKSIKCLFPNDAGEIDEVKIATFDISEYSFFANCKDQQSLYPFSSPMLKGKLSICCVAGDNLYVIDNYSKIYSFSLNHAALKFKFLVQGGRVNQSLQWLTYIPNELHLHLAQFLCERGYSKLVMGIKTIKPSNKLNLTMKFGNVKECFELVKFLEEFPDEELSNEDISGLFLNLAILIEKRKEISLFEKEILEKCYKNSFKFDSKRFRNLAFFYKRENRINDLVRFKNSFLGNEEFKEQVLLISVLLDDKEGINQLKGDFPFLDSSKVSQLGDLGENLRKKYPTFLECDFQH